MNKTMTVLAASAAVALGAYSVQAQDATNDVTGYIPLTVSGTFTEGFQTVNASGTAVTYTAKTSAITEKQLLALFFTWYTNDTGDTSLKSFATSTYQLGVLWDYTTEQPGNGGGYGDIVILKSGALFYDPTTVATSDSGGSTHTFEIYMPAVTTDDLDYNNYATILNGKTAILSTNGVNIYNSTQGAGTLNYELTSSFYLEDTTGETVISDADLTGTGKTSGTATFAKNGLEDKVGFSFTAFGAFGTLYGGKDNPSGTAESDTIVINLTFKSGNVTIPATSTTSPSGQPF